MMPAVRSSGARQRTKRLLFAAPVALGLAALPGQAAWAHGGVAMEKDVCKLSIGPYLMHFTGYLPQSSRQEFCEDIPMTGRTVIVLDFLDDVVRDQPLGFRIVRDTGLNNPELEPVVYDAKARSYPTGSAAFQYDIKETGRYIGIVTLEGNEHWSSVFPFQVGRMTLWHNLLMAAAALCAGAVLLFRYAASRRGRAITVAV